METLDVSKRKNKIKIVRLKFMVSLQSITWVFPLNNFSRIINLLLTKLAQNRTGRISTLGLFCMDLTVLGRYCQDLGPIFSQYGPRAWSIRYMYSEHFPLITIMVLIVITSMSFSYFPFITMMV